MQDKLGMEMLENLTEQLKNDQLKQFQNMGKDLMYGATHALFMIQKR